MHYQFLSIPFIVLFIILILILDKIKKLKVDLQYKEDRINSLIEKNQKLLSDNNLLRNQEQGLNRRVSELQTELNTLKGKTTNKNRKR